MPTLLLPNQPTLGKLERYWLITLVLSVLAVLMIISPAYAVGYKRIVDNDLKIDVWYPSPAAEEENRLGPFDVTLAFDAEPEREGRFQIVLLSHGNSGHPRNHHLTAKALVEAGFIVVGPVHAVDHLVAGWKNIPKVLEWRTTELRHAIEALLQDEEFRRIVDLSRIHAVGYSLGGFTTLQAAGASIDLEAARAHCEAEDDPAFCEEQPFYQRWMVKFRREVTTPDLNREIAPLYFSFGFVNGGVAVVAPVGQGIGVDPNTFQANSVMVVGLDQDTIALPRYHASYLNELFSEHVETEYHLMEAHHSAFIAPFAKRVPNVERIPAAIDPEGFDRAAFLNDVNNRLVSFFRKSRDVAGRPN